MNVWVHCGCSKKETIKREGGKEGKGKKTFGVEYTSQFFLFSYGIN